ncbi:histidine kinase [Larkinella arboricola]|uniref:Histidine kinase n=1 Tax=Larkinella arboricola TaxID=643671 RepID=A0A327WNQ7_LARAB|nr:sensor histidine kinase [Larkinella arboricola]RAJ89887.1 histidine kinase [Larkinella arboricola]
MSRESDPVVELRMLSSAQFWLFITIYIAAFYANYLLLLPVVYLKQRYIFYLGCFVIGLLIVHYTQPFENLVFQRFHQPEFFQPRPQPGPPPDMPPNDFPPPPRPMQNNRPSVDFVSLVLFVVVWVIAMAVKISEQWRLSEKRIILSEAEKAQAELSFFKAQINPHFLFNTLNNIYSLAVSQSENTAPSIMKLSKMMRYITEEATENFVPLEDEIACLENYIDLQRLRLNEKTKVVFEANDVDSQIKIAPLILMTFVENAFKYGVSNHFGSKIEIKVTGNAGTIRFFCANRIFNANLDPERTGVGIANTRKRLDFLYPERYNLLIDNDGTNFTINLKLRSQ